MIRWIDQPSIVPFLACVAEEQKKEFRDYVVKRMIEETKQSDGRCFETFRRINVCGPQIRVDAARGDRVRVAGNLWKPLTRRDILLIESRLEKYLCSRKKRQNR